MALSLLQILSLELEKFWQMCVMSLGLFLRGCLFAAESARKFSVQLAQCKAQGVSPGFRARDDEEDGGKALNARQEEDGRQKPIRQPESRVPSFSQLFRPLEDQDTARKKVKCETIPVLR